MDGARLLRDDRLATTVDLDRGILLLNTSA